MPTLKYDYDELERQFVQGDMSIRQLCKSNDIKTWSTVNDYAKRNAWAEKREHFGKRVAEAELTVVVEKRANDLAKALDDSISVSSAAVWAFFDSLKDRWVVDDETGERTLVPGQVIYAADFVKIMEKLMVLSGQATERHSSLNVNVNEAGPTMEMLRDLATAARQAGADTGSTESSPLPRSDRARPLN